MLSARVSDLCGRREQDRNLEYEPAQILYVFMEACECGRRSTESMTYLCQTVQYVS